MGTRGLTHVVIAQATSAFCLSCLALVYQFSTTDREISRKGKSSFPIACVFKKFIRGSLSSGRLLVQFI